MLTTVVQIMSCSPSHPLHLRPQPASTLPQVCTSVELACRPWPHEDSIPLTMPRIRYPLRIIVSWNVHWIWRRARPRRRVYSVMLRLKALRYFSLRTKRVRSPAGLRTVTSTRRVYSDVLARRPHLPLEGKASSSIRVLITLHITPPQQQRPSPHCLAHTPPLPNPGRRCHLGRHRKISTW